MTSISLYAVILLLGTATQGVQENAGKPLTVAPTEFFSGELKRLKDHVDFKAWCFKIESSGSKSCRPELEMWCDGRRVDVAKYGVGVPDSDVELTLSLRMKALNGQPAFDVRTGGLFPHGRVFEKPQSTQKVEVEFGPVAIRRPILLRPKESTIVWVMGAGHHDVILGNQAEVEKMLKSAPWVLVLRLTAE